jgi:hypothetical protein
MCAKYIGRRVNVGIAKETVRGTAVAATYSVPKTNLTVDDKANVVRSGESFGDISGVGSQSIVAGRMSAGALEGEINVNSFGLILLSALGSVSTVAQNSDYKHTFTMANTNIHQSLTIHVENPNNEKYFAGSVIDSLEINVAPEEIVTFSAGFKGRKGNDTTYTASYTTEDFKFVGRDLSFKVAADTTGLAAATALSVKALKLTINKNSDYDWVCGTLEPEDVLNKQVTIQGQITFNYEDDTWKNYMTGGTKRAVRIQLTNTRDTMASENPSFLLDLYSVDFSEWEPQLANDDIATQTINFTALYDYTNAKMIANCYLVSAVASY